MAIIEVGPQCMPQSLYCSGGAHYSMFKTLVVKSQALLQIQRLLLIPMRFSQPLLKREQCLKQCIEAMFEAFEADFLILLIITNSLTDRVM
jgi:hypothetical protein